MIQCLVFSDSHGRALSRMQRVIASHPEAQIVFFLGDGLSEAEALPSAFPDRTFLFVRGNCDFAPLYPTEETDEITLEGVKLVFTHGHKYDAKLSLAGLRALAARRGAGICLFGHTHHQTQEYCGEGDLPFTLFNPGSIGQPDCGRPSYGVLTLSEGQYLLSVGFCNDENPNINL